MRTMKSAPRTDAVERLLSKLVPKPNGCWEWSGWRQPSGHGQAFFLGRLMPAHRAVFMALNRLFDLHPDQVVRHKCDNPPCCNPDHLCLGTHSDNMSDCVERKRHVSFTKRESYLKGEQCHRAKLSTSDVLNIKRLIATGVSCQQISQHYPITASGVSKIKFGKSWPHVRIEQVAS